MISDYTQRLRQWRIGLRAGSAFALPDIGELWAMNFAPTDPLQWEFPIGGSIDAYVMFGESAVWPQYNRIIGFNEFTPAGTFLDGCDALALTIRPRDNFDAVPFVEVEIASPTEITVTDLASLSTFDGGDGSVLTLATTPAKAYSLPFDLTGAPLRRAVTAVGGRLPATLQLAWSRGGFTGAIVPVPITLTA